MKIFKLTLLPILLIGLILTGCDAESMNDDKDVDLTLRLQGVFGGQQLVVGQEYDHNGAAITLSTARVYLSEIVLTTADGEEVAFTADPITIPAKDENDNDVSHTVTDRIILVKSDLGEEMYHMGTAPAGDYQSARFRVGIMGLDNRIDASQVPATHALAKQTDKNNHWNWANGYIYLRLDGQVDTDGDGEVDDLWEAHIGKENFSREVTINTPFTLDAETGNMLHFMVDYQQFISTVNPANPAERISHTGDNIPVANKVANNMSGAFMLHGVHMHESMTSN